jgi:hypothetical protein
MCRVCVCFCFAVMVVVSAGCEYGTDLEKNTAPIEWIYVGSANGPAFQNGWNNTVSTGDQDLAFGIDSDGFLHIVGEITDSSPVSSAEIVFQLPERYRPKKTQYTEITCWGSGYITCDVSFLSTGGFYIGGVNPSSAYLNLIFKID